VSAVDAAVEISTDLEAYLMEQAVPLLEEDPVATGRGRRRLEAVVPSGQRSVVVF
jgi:hypothetical protein